MLESPPGFQTVVSHVGQIADRFSGALELLQQVAVAGAD